jgi:hypothetical protein
VLFAWGFGGSGENRKMNFKFQISNEKLEIGELRIFHFSFEICNLKFQAGGRER